MPKTFMGKSTKLGGGGRFAMLMAKAAKNGAKNPAAVAAKAGRKKLGAKKMAQLAVKGQKRAAKGRKKITRHKIPNNGNDGEYALK